MTSPMLISGPRARDELADWSDAALWDGPMGEPLPMGAIPWTGRLVRIGDGQRVFVRHTAATAADHGGAAGGGQAFYVHGLGGSSTNWTALAGLMAPQAAGWSIDLPGCGRSDPPPGGDYSISAQVRSIAEVVDSVSTEPVHLVGNSYGGYLCAFLAEQRPDLIRTLTLISPAVPDLRFVRDRGADARMALLLTPGLAALAAPRLAAISPAERAAGMATLCLGQPDSASEADLRSAAADLQWRQDLPWAHRAMLEQLRGLMRHYLSATKRSFWAAGRRVALPTLVVWGTRDRLVDVRLSRRTAAAFADSRLLVLSGVGHVAQMEAPLPTARAMTAMWAEGSAIGPRSR